MTENEVVRELRPFHVVKWGDVHPEGYHLRRGCIQVRAQDRFIPVPIAIDNEDAGRALLVETEKGVRAHVGLSENGVGLFFNRTHPRFGVCWKAIIVVLQDETVDDVVYATEAKIIKISLVSKELAMVSPSPDLRLMESGA